jgi:hypothetical protein
MEQPERRYGEQVRAALCRERLQGGTSERGHDVPSVISSSTVTADWASLDLDVVLDPRQLVENQKWQLPFDDVQDSVEELRD